MQTTLILSTAMMGLVGGPHCVAMCGGVCAAMQQSGRSQYALFQVGRVLGYASLGALAAGSLRGVAWLSTQTLALHPLWTFSHVMILVWGGMLLVSARQPYWVDALGRQLWQRVQNRQFRHSGILALGMVWSLMPCGLLYSALLIAGLSTQWMVGALCMAAFALTSSISLIVTPLVWRTIKQGRYGLSEAQGMRMAGGLLASVAAIALWMDVVHTNPLFCIASN